MRGKVLILTGLAVGYVLGARAGRERYEEIKKVAAKVWNDPRVQVQVEKVEDFAKDASPVVLGYVSTGVRKVASTVSDVTRSKPSSARKSAAKKSSSSSSSAAKSSSSSASKPAAKKPAAKSTTAKKTTPAASDSK